MGKSDDILYSSLYKDITPYKETALFGFSNNDRFDGDLYDKKLGNWDINDQEWNFIKKYQTMICLRCAYFCKNIPVFLNNCHQNLYENGMLYIDFGLGDHWRFQKYKVGWVRDDEHEWAYDENNKLYSCLWDKKFLKTFAVKQFIEYIKPFYDDENIDLEKIIEKEIPHIVTLDMFREYFIIKSIELKLLWPERPQLYIMLKCQKKEL